MNNEPVAWIAKTYYPNGLFEEDLVWSKVDENSIPLYPHPVKELDDYEIQQISYRYHYTYNPDYIGFARDVLKKAREK